MDRLSVSQRKKNMSAVKSKGSKIETALCKSLWAEGLRYRKNDNTVFGKPDITFKKLKIAVFTDSEFWHGKDWDIKKNEIRSNQEFWIKKIERNIQRDIEVNAKLRSDGWQVIRFWGKDIQKNLRHCTLAVINIIDESKNQIPNKRYT